LATIDSLASPQLDADQVTHGSELPAIYRYGVYELTHTRMDLRIPKTAAFDAKAVAVPGIPS
jgi:hypothetical protein